MAWFITRPAVVRRRGFILGVPAPAGRRRPDAQCVVRCRPGRRCRRVRIPAPIDSRHQHARRAARRRDRPRAGQRHRRGAVLGRSRRPAGGVPPQLHPAAAAVPRPGRRRPQGRVARAGADDDAVPAGRPGAPLQDPRHLGDHRRAHRRPVRHRIHGRHAGDSAVRPQGAPAGRRLVGFDEAQPRPPRPRHPPEDPEDVRRGRR